MSDLATTPDQDADEGTWLESPRMKLAGLATALIIMAIYNVIFINKSFSMTEGWFSAYANRVLHGKVPYRDFHLSLPPLYTLQIAVVLRLFGDSFMPLRVLGFGLMMGITGVIYLLYSRVFSGPVACVAAVFAMMLLESGVAHIPYDFHFFVMLYGLSAALLLIKACESADFADEARPGRRALAWLAAAGVLAEARLLLNKQSNGLAIIAAAARACLCRPDLVRPGFPQGDREYCRLWDRIRRPGDRRPRVADGRRGPRPFLQARSSSGPRRPRGAWVASCSVGYRGRSTCRG